MVIVFSFFQKKHIHIISGNGEAKFWLESDIELAKKYGHSRKQLKEIELLIEGYHHKLISMWKQHFGS